MLYRLKFSHFSKTLQKKVSSQFNRRYSNGPRIQSQNDKIYLESMRSHPKNNIPLHIEHKVGKNLHLIQNHPLNIISSLIEKHFHETSSRQTHNLKIFKDLSPIVTIQQNFDELLIPIDHVSRSPNDTYYVNDNEVLRCHTSAHQTELMREGNNFFLVIGDVYRRDTIDVTHFPIFHQMEGVKIYENDPSNTSDFIINDMKKHIEGMVDSLFGKVEKRWVEAYFPFTHPSLELEIFYNNEWLEVLGCGAIHPKILENTGHKGKNGWAFGFGLERLAMVLFDIPDIRLFWSEDSRFISQFNSGGIVKFKPFSNQPVCYKDISFWIPEGFHSHTFYELVRQLTGDIVEDVKLIDQFVHPKTGKESHCYRLNYRAMDRTLTNEEIDKLQFELRDKLVKLLNVELR